MGGIELIGSLKIQLYCELVIFKLISVIDILSISHQISHRRMPQDYTYD